MKFIYNAARVRELMIGIDHTILVSMRQARLSDGSIHHVEIMDDDGAWRTLGEDERFVPSRPPLPQTDNSWVR